MPEFAALEYTGNSIHSWMNKHLVGAQGFSVQVPNYSPSHAVHRLPQNYGKVGLWHRLGQ